MSASSLRHGATLRAENSCDLPVSGKQYFVQKRTYAEYFHVFGDYDLPQANWLWILK